MMKKLQLILNSICILTVALLVFCIASPRVQHVKVNEKIVLSSTYDSLVAIANRPPKITIDTIRDTIRVAERIPYKVKYDSIIVKEVPVKIDSKVAQDILQTPYFTVFLTDSIHENDITRAWNYEVYKEAFLTTIEVEKPVLVPTEPNPSPYGLYLGAEAYYMFNKTYLATMDLSLLTRKNRMWSIKAGAMITNKATLTPAVGVGFKIKF